METCSGIGVELRPWGKNDKDFLLLTEGSSHFRRCLVQLRGLISHLIRASSCAKDYPVILRLLHICCSAESWKEMSRAEVGRQKRNDSCIEDFNAFLPRGHMKLCRSEHCGSGFQPAPYQSLAKHCAPCKAGIKKVDQDHGRSQWGGYFSNISILQLLHCAFVWDAVSALN